jgi:hypothetical protein
MDALHIVLREHAGCLGSYDADARARIARVLEISDECEDIVVPYMRNGEWERVSPVRDAAFERLRRFAPHLMKETYRATYFHVKKLQLKRQSDDRRNVKRREQRRLRKEASSL